VENIIFIFWFVLWAYAGMVFFTGAVFTAIIKNSLQKLAFFLIILGCRGKTNKNPWKTNRKTIKKIFCEKRFSLPHSWQSWQKLKIWEKRTKNGQNRTKTK
jgi:hypothetical protein